MIGTDFFLVLRWWGTLFLVGAAAFPLTKALFNRTAPGSGLKEPQGLTPFSWWDNGYLFSKAVGMALVTWIIYVLGTVRVMPFGIASITTSLILVFLLGRVLLLVNYESGIRNYGEHKHKTVIHYSLFIIQVKKHWKQIAIVLVEELFFLAVLVFWSWIKAHEPSIRGLEKFMDFGFMKSILESQYFPPGDMWYPPLPINYYYFGHMVTAVLTKLSGLDLTYTFNLMLASIFALTLTMSFSIGRQIGGVRGIRGIGGGVLTAFLVTLAGNMQTIYAFTRGYTGENVRPFWKLLWNVGPESPPAFWVKEIWANLLQGMNTYWYANATRFIPLTIHEFPSYSFVVSDVHGHVLSIPFVLLAIALLIHMFSGFAHKKGNNESGIMNHGILQIGFYGALCGILLMTNALDGPIYFGLFLVLLLIHNSLFIIQWRKYWKQIGLMIGIPAVAVVVTSLPFLSHFKSFVTGLAVNCPPEFLANTKVGHLLFEGVEKCQRSPLWMLWILWGFFIYCGGGLLVTLVKFRKLDKLDALEKLLLVFFFFSLALIIFPEFFYFKDIYPAHFRSNTMFKLGYQAFILFSIVAAYSIVGSVGNQGDKGKRGRTFFFVFLLPQLFLVSIYPIFSVRSYFNGLSRYGGLNGLTWLAREYPDDYSAIQWLNGDSLNNDLQRSLAKREREGVPPFTLVEADGDSYTDYERFSVFTGIPTIIGWGVHEWLWRGSYDVVAPRREEVRQIYESGDLGLTRTILAKYGVRYVVVGELERRKFSGLAEWKFSQLGTVAFQQGLTAVYNIR